MKDTMITEFVKFNVLETTTDEQLISKADILISSFRKKQDGFVDAELVKDVEDNAWYFIYHYESLEKLKIAGAKMRESNEFGEFVPLIVPGSINVTFYHRLRKW